MTDVQTSKTILSVSNDENFSEVFLSALKKAVPLTHVLKNTSIRDSAKVAVETSPVIVFFDTRVFSDDLYPAIKTIATECHGASIVGAGHPSNVEQILEFVRLGVKDFVGIPPTEAEIKGLFNRLQTQNAQMAPLVKESKIIAVYGAKGGTGATFLTANLAVALAKDKSKRVAVCDFSLECGDVPTYLNLETRYTIADVIDNVRLLDISFLEGMMLEHPTGVRILSSPRENQNPLSAPDSQTLELVLSLLSTHYDYTLIDVGRLDMNLVRMILAESDILLLLGNPDVPSLRGLVALVKKLDLSHYDPGKIKVIINRSNSKNQIDVKEFEKLSRHDISLYLPNNYAVCIQAVNTGESVFTSNPKSDLARKIDELANLIKKFEFTKKNEPPDSAH